MLPTLSVRARSSLWLHAGFGLFIVATGLVGGLAVATGAKLLIVPVFGLVAGLFLLMLPAQWLLLTLLAVAFVVVGVVGYTARISQIYWLPYIFGLVVWLHVLVEWALRRAPRTGPWPFVLWAFVGYLLMLGVNALTNPQAPGIYLIAAKNYLFLLGVFLAGYTLIREPRTYQRIWTFLLLVAVLQLPAVIYQYVVVGGRIAAAGGHGWDAVSGTFGGTESGGHSGFMGIYLVLMLVLLMGLVRHGQMSWRRALPLGALCLVPVLMAEVKAVYLVFLPLALSVFFRKAMLGNPLKAVAGVLGMLALLALFIQADQLLHFKGVKQDRTVLEIIDDAVTLDTDPEHTRVRTGEMGRTALLVLWWRHHDAESAHQMLFGHGLGSMRISSFYVGEVQKLYPRQRLDKHALSMLLWDIGLVGALAFVLLLASGARLSLRLSQDVGVPARHRAYLETGGILLTMALVSLIYSRSVVDHHAMIVLVMLSLGQAVYWYYRLREQPAVTS